MKWLQVIISIPTSGDSHATAHICFGPGTDTELDELHANLISAAVARGVRVDPGVSIIGKRQAPPTEQDYVEAIPKDAGVYLDQLLVEAVELVDALQRGEFRAPDNTGKL